MNDNINNEELSTSDIVKQKEKLEKENAKITKRLNRIIEQGDRQHKQFEKLNEELGTYIDVIDDHVITMTIDTKRNISNISTAFSNLFGFKSKELINENFEFLLDSDDVNKIYVDLQDISISKEQWHGEIRFKSKSDNLIWTNTIITPNFDENELIGYTFIINDISKDKQIQELKSKELSQKKYDQGMLDFMSSRSSALLQRTSNSFSYILWLIFATVVWLIVWANYAELEELTRGSGKIIPSKQVQIIESFDNARVDKILVSEGDLIKKGQLLLRFNNIENSSILEQNSMKLQELKAKAKRLKLESQLLNTDYPLNNDLSKSMKDELALYRANIEQLNLKMSSMNEKIKQKTSEFNEASKKETHLKENYDLLLQELKIKEQMAKEKIISEIEYIQLKREKNDLSQELNKIKNEILRAKSSIIELKQNKLEMKLEFQNKAKKELLDILSEIAKLSQMHTSFDDKLKRTEIISPIDGIIKKMHVNTIGEVAEAGSTLFELVPLKDSMIAEVKIAPEDIAYLKIDQEAMMKFSAYDFNIYGGIKAKISYISADTIFDTEDSQDYYIVHLKLDKNYVGDKDKQLNIKVGMIADVDIIHGKKSIMDYILKPILKAKQNALTEK